MKSENIAMSFLLFVFVFWKLKKTNKSKRIDKTFEKKEIVNVANSGKKGRPNN